MRKMTVVLALAGLSACNKPTASEAPVEAVPAAVSFDGADYRDEAGKLILSKGKQQSDSNLRDTESVPLTEDIAAYVAREVLPFAPDAWIDQSKSKVGYEIPFTRYFYKYEAPKPADQIMAEILEIEKELDGSLAEMFGV